MTYECPICGDRYVTVSGLNAHAAKPHHPCPECGALRVKVNQHISKAHREDPVERGRRISAGMHAANERRRARR